MATYRLNHQKLKFLGVILLFLPLIVSVLAEIDEDFDSVEYIPEESRETDNETEYEDADDSETTSSFSQDFLKESDSGTAPVEKPSSFYSFSVHDIHGDLVSLGEYRGKVMCLLPQFTLSQGFPCPSKKGDFVRDFSKCPLNFLS